MVEGTKNQCWRKNEADMCLILLNVVKPTRRLHVGPLHVYIISLSRVSSSLSNHIIIIYISYLTPLQKLNSKFKNIELSTTIICDKTAKVLTTLGSDFFCPKNSCVCVLRGFSVVVLCDFFIFFIFMF